MKKLAVLLTIAATTTLLVACGSAAKETIRAGESGAVLKSQDSSSVIPYALHGVPVPGPAGPAGAAGAAGPVFFEGFDKDQSTATSWMLNSAAATSAPRPTARPMPAMAPSSKEMAPGQPGAPSSQLDTIQRQVISTASLTIEVKAVQAATSQVRAIAEGLGGFMEQLSSFGDAKNQQATMTIRVPQPQFFTAMERLEALGKVQNNNLGSEDVSSQFIDLKARLASALREEQSLLSLLGKANTVTEILTIERELSRVRSEIERLQGQLNFLERRVELATITVSLFPPQAELVQPPSGSLNVEVSDVTSKVAEVRSLMATLGGKVDGVTLLIREEQQTAKVSLRVFDDKFDLAITSLEGLGEVTHKQLQQGASTTVLEKDRPEHPNAPIFLTLIKPVEESKAWLWWAIGGPIGGVALVALLVVLVYRAGSRRRV